MKHLKFFGTGVWMAGMLLSACSDHVLTAEEQRGSLNSQTQVHDTSAATSTFKAGFLSNSVGQTIAVGLQSLNTGSIPVTPTQSLALPCEFKVTKINYNTVGAAGEAATATADRKSTRLNSSH